MKSTTSLRDITENNFAHLKRVTEGDCKYKNQVDSSDAWFLDTHGRHCVKTDQHRTEMENERLNLALEQHHNDANKRLDMACYPTRGRQFLLTYDHCEVVEGINFDKFEWDWLFLCGSNGTGKTTLAGRLGWEWMKKSPVRESVFLSVPDWIHNLKSRGDENQIVELPKLKSFVILDDFDKLQFTEWQILNIFRLVDYLYRTDYRVIFTSNRSVDKIIELSDCHANMKATIDRIRGRAKGSIISIPGKSFRKI